MPALNPPSHITSLPPPSQGSVRSSAFGLLSLQGLKKSKKVDKQTISQPISLFTGPSKAAQHTDSPVTPADIIYAIQENNELGRSSLAVPERTLPLKYQGKVIRAGSQNEWIKPSLPPAVNIEKKGKQKRGWLCF